MDMGLLFAIVAFCLAGYLVYLLLVDCRSSKTAINTEPKIATLKVPVQKQRELRSITHTKLTSNFKKSSYHNNLSI